MGVLKATPDGRREGKDRVSNRASRLRWMVIGVMVVRLRFGMVLVKVVDEAAKSVAMTIYLCRKSKRERRKWEADLTASPRA
jgi:hypothetical protein